MFKRRFRLPSPALVISMITLSLVLGGTAFAAATAKHGDAKADKKLVKKMAPSLKVKYAKTAGSAANATHATSADSATNATNATNATTAANATNATNATTAANATALGGHTSGYYAHAGHEAVHLIGAAGEPTFQNGWDNFSAGTWSSAGYWKDAFGVVHLTGTLDGANADTVAFTLPAGYRPASDDFMVAGNVATATSLEVLTTGDVKPTGSGSVGLDSVTFLAGTQSATARHQGSGRDPNGR
jgi:hypothetical protein